MWSNAPSGPRATNAARTGRLDESQKLPRDEIEPAQPEYWEKRLTRKTNLQIRSGSVGWAQLDSMRQAGLLEQAIEDRQAQLFNGHQEIEP